MYKLELTIQSQHFLKSLEKAGKSFNTVKNYKADINAFIKFLSENGHKLELNEVSHLMLVDYQRYLEKTYSSSNSIRRRVQALRLLFDWLIEKDLYHENPIKKMIPKAKVLSAPSPLMYNNVIKLHDYLVCEIKSNKGLSQLLSKRNLLIFYLIYGSGLKVSDIESLSPDHILDSKEMRVLITPTKRDPYSIPIDLSFKSFYLNYLISLEKEKTKSDIYFKQLLFNANPYKILSGGLSSRGIEIIFKEVSKKLNFSVTAKSLRQACIFKWISLDKSKAQIKEWMGVQPQYSLAPYLELYKENTDQFMFQEIKCFCLDKANESRC